MYRTLNVRLGRKLYFDDISEKAHRKKLTAKEIECLSDLSYKYKKYVIKSESINGKEIGMEYMFSDRKIQFEDILRTLLPLRDRMDIWLYSDVEWEKKDFDEAVAFLFNFNKVCPEYDDEKYNHSQINCLTCWCKELKEKVYAKPTAALKKAFDGNKTGASIEESDVHIISDSLYEHLINSGIECSCFKPVFDKKNQVWAKMLNGTNNILPSLSMYYEYYDTVEICSNCGKIIIKPSYGKKNSSFWYDFDEGKRFGQYPCSEKWIIKKELVAQMGDVNITKDFYIEERCMVISKRLFDLICEYNPKIIKVSTPIFAEEFSLINNQGEIKKSETQPVVS